MINYQVFGLCHLLRSLYQEEVDAERRIAILEYAKQQPGIEREQVSGIFIDELITDQDIDRIKGWLSYSSQQATQLELQAVHDRIDIFTRKVRVRIRLHDFLAEVRALRETFETGLNFKYFYRYPQNKAIVLIKFPGEWQPIADKFRSAVSDAEAAVDCWALGHHTASVFHLIRVAEIGLRALARERRVKLPRKQVLEWADWHGVIDGIRKKVDLIAGRKRGPKRDAALEFYRGALGSFEGFKDAYRNNVMHMRKSYNETEATALREHVFHFMHRLAEKMDETGKKQITWGIR